MDAAIQAFASGFDNFLISVIAAGALLVVGCVVYVLLTPMKEMELVRAGNSSAGLGLAGVIIGLAIPIASALATSLSLFDLLIWGVVALLIQMLAFRIVDLILKDLPKRIENDEPGAAIVLIAVKIASALLVGAALWVPPAPIM